MIAHLDKQAVSWVEKYTEKINAKNGQGLKQAFALHMNRASVCQDARSDPRSAIAIIETYGS
jgi:hypothetical protein